MGGLLWGSGVIGKVFALLIMDESVCMNQWGGCKIPKKASIIYDCKKKCQTGYAV